MQAITNNDPTVMPPNMEDARGLVLKLREDAPKHSVSNFERGEYVFTLSDNSMYAGNARIRLFPREEYPQGRVHFLAMTMGYEKLRTLFQVVGRLPGIH